MIKSQGIDQVGKLILEQKSAKRDFIADTRALRLNESGRLVFNLNKQEVEFGPTDLCIDQISERVGIPRKYADKLRTVAPELLATNVNHWFQSTPEKRMLRTFQNGENVARAFLSDRFRPLDNIDIASHILPKLEKTQCEIKSTAITDKRLYIQAIHSKMTAEIKHVGDVVHAGVVISNSEVGCGSLRIEHMIYTLRCTNGMVGEDIIKAYHVGRGSKGDLDLDSAQEYFKDETRRATDHAFWMRVSDMVDHSLSKDKFDSVVARLNKSAEVEIEKPVEVIEVFAERFDWQKDEQESILNHFIKGGMTSQYGLLNAVTRTAEDSKNYDRAVELERQGGEIMLLPATDFSTN